MILAIISGRGGRSLIYFKDESAWYVHPEMIEAALSGNARVQIDMSSVHGIGTVFDRKIEAGVLLVTRAIADPRANQYFRFGLV